MIAPDRTLAALHSAAVSLGKLGPFPGLDSELADIYHTAEDELITVEAAFDELYELAVSCRLAPSPATEASLYGDDAQAFLDDPEAACL